MEVSSHALALHRADAIHFAAAVFTNLTQDHLDFHPTMEDYFEAKRLLFTAGGGGVASEATARIVNVDDPVRSPPGAGARCGRDDLRAAR